MSMYLSNTLLLNHQTHARYHRQIGIPHERCLRPDAHINPPRPFGNNLVTKHRRTPICQSAEEVLELSEESVEEALQVNQPIPTLNLEKLQSACIRVYVMKLSQLANIAWHHLSHSFPGFETGAHAVI